LIDDGSGQTNFRLRVGRLQPARMEDSEELIESGRIDF